MSVIWLVDDEPSVLRGLERLLGAEGFETRSFLDPATFLGAHDPALPGCAIIDLGLQDASGLALQQALAQDCGSRPVIFLTGQGSIASAVAAMRAGAVDFLTKPVDAETLFAAIRKALDADNASRRDLAELEVLEARLASLTRREREVLQEVMLGHRNKQIAHQLGAAEKTIKVHRGRVMRKMGVGTVAELVTLMRRRPNAERA